MHANEAQESQNMHLSVADTQFMCVCVKCDINYSFCVNSS